MSDEQEIESRIQDSAPTNRRLTPRDIDAAIADIKFHRFPDTTLTVCCLVLRNGYCVTGESAAADPANYHKEIGMDIAFDNARAKIWALEGYLLKNDLWTMRSIAAAKAALAD